MCECNIEHLLSWKGQWESWKFQKIIKAESLLCLAGLGIANSWSIDRAIHIISAVAAWECLKSWKTTVSYTLTIFNEGCCSHVNSISFFMFLGNIVHNLEIWYEINNKRWDIMENICVHDAIKEKLK
jgi:hypothetical protein